MLTLRKRVWSTQRTAKLTTAQWVRMTSARISYWLEHSAYRCPICRVNHNLDEVWCTW